MSPESHVSAHLTLSSLHVCGKGRRQARACVFDSPGLRKWFVAYGVAKARGICGRPEKNTYGSMLVFARVGYNLLVGPSGVSPAVSKF